MKNTLRQRLAKYFNDRSAMVFSGGEMERFVSARTDYKPSTISRRLREMAEDGIITATYEKGTVFYQWNSETEERNKKAAQSKAQAVDLILRNHLTPLASQLRTAREQTEMAKVQLTLI